MKLGLFLPHVGHGASAGAVRDIAAAAEELGFASVWTGDHLAPPDSYEPPWESGVFSGTPDEVVRVFKECAAVPVDHTVVALGGGTAARLAAMERIARDVAPGLCT